MSSIRVGVACIALVTMCGTSQARERAEQPLQSAASTANDRLIRDVLHLSGYSLATLRCESDAAVAERMHVHLAFDDRPMHLILDPHSMRAPGFMLITDDHAAEPPRIRTFRGRDALTGHEVAATVIDGQVSAAIRGPGEPIFVQPLSEIIPGASQAEHVVYTASQVMASDWRCDGDHVCEGCGGSHTGIAHRGDPVDAACMRTVEVVFDGDYPYFQNRGSSVASATTDIESVANQVDLIYRRDVGVAVAIKQITLRTSASADPYAAQPLSGVVPGTLLSLVSSVWSGMSTPSRDLVHLMTGRDLQSSTIGIAWVGVVCRSSNNNTGVSQTLFTSNLAMRTILTAHEMGHNFGASHDSGGSFIMASGVSPSIQQQFSPGSISTINSFVNANNACLTASGPVAAADAATTRAPSAVLIDVLANDTAGCAGALGISLPSSIASNGGGIVISSGTGPGGRNQVRYTPPPTVPASGLTDTFSYRLTESGATGTATGSVTVTVQPASTQTCAGDFNSNGSVTVQDVFDFLAAYFGGSSQADINRSGGISVQDVFDYLAVYFRGCP